MAAFNKNHIVCFRELRGGLAIANPNHNDPGTLGFIATANGQDRWLVSCYHVLCRPRGTPMSTNLEPIVYFFDDAQSPIAHVSNARVDEKLDCAAGEITAAAAIGRILGIGTIHPLPVQARVGMRVIKAGAATGVTEGVIVDVNVGRPGALRIESPDMATDYMVCARGDSGSLWVDADTLRPVGLHVAGLPADETRVGFAALIEAVLEKLGGLRVVAD